MTAERDIQRLIATLTDGGSEAHADITPAVHALAEIGLPAASAVLDTMLEDDEMRRLVAQRAFERILMRSADEDALLKLWRANGNYAYDADPGARVASVARWRAWLREQERTP